MKVQETKEMSIGNQENYLKSTLSGFSQSNFLVISRNMLLRRAPAPTSQITKFSFIFKSS